MNNEYKNNFEEDDNSTNTGKSKWKERLYKFKINFKKSLKYLLIVPSIVYNAISPIKKNKKENELSKKEMLKVKEIRQKKNNIVISKQIVNSKQTAKTIEKDLEHQVVTKRQNAYKIKQINEINNLNLLKKGELILKNKLTIPNKEKTKTTEELEKEKLQREIISLIRKKLVKSINELEILESELYLLKELGDEDIYLEQCKGDIKEIKKMLISIKSLKEKYDYLKDNIDFDDVLNYNDNELVDKIIDLKNLCSREDMKKIIDDYKLLDDYKFLYLKIDKLEEKLIKYEDYKNDKTAELKDRDIDFDKMKNQIYDVDREDERYNRFVRDQEYLLKNLNENVNKIESHEKVTYHMKGFNQLLGNSFKYLGLLLASPLKGLLPSISSQLVSTRNVIKNLYNNLEVEETRRTIYETIDYSLSLNAAIDNIDDNLSMANLTLEDIKKLKDKYKQKFKKYENDVYGYQDAIRKINKMETNVIASKVKLMKMKEQILIKKKQNENKLMRVKKLNENSPVVKRNVKN